VAWDSRTIGWVHDLLRSVWDEPRPANPPPRTWRDWALVAVLVAAALTEGLLRPDLPSRAISVAVAVGLVPTLLWRRSRPLQMVAIAFGLCAAASLLIGRDLDLYVLIYLLLLPYSLFRWGSGREALIGSAIIIGKIVLASVLGYQSLSDLFAGFIILFAASALSAALRYRAKARTRELDQAKLLERERLARDLHDTVAHHVSAMAIRAQAGLATSATNPQAAVEALSVIEAEASRALAEMRAMVRVLRHDEPADLAPSPRVSDLGRLARRFRDRPAVEVKTSGDVNGLPPAVGTAIYRLAQESITNARRHARHATRIDVNVSVEDASVRLRVSDDGEHNAMRAVSSPGYGLVGMIERATLLGGSCEAGPAPGGGWTVTAVLPTPPRPTNQTPETTHPRRTPEALRHPQDQTPERNPPRRPRDQTPEATQPHRNPETPRHPQDQTPETSHPHRNPKAPCRPGDQTPEATHPHPETSRRPRDRAAETTQSQRDPEHRPKEQTPVATQPGPAA